jgi:glyoxylase-like metal-dependent hydrolase (beta-lactamase superfamily II)
MRELLLLLLLLVGSRQVSHSQATNQLYTNYQRALRVLDRALAAHGGLARLCQPVEVTATGYYYNAGHYALPHETRQWPLQEVFSAYEPADHWLLRSQLTIDKVVHPQATWLSADTVYKQEYFAKAAQLQRGATAEASRQELRTAWPASLLLLAHECRASLRLLDSTQHATSLTFATPGGSALLLQIGPANTLDRVEWLEYNPTTGDDVVTVDYQHYHQQQGLLLPTRRLEKRLGLLEKELTYGPCRPLAARPDSALLVLGAPHSPAHPTAPSAAWQVLPVGTRLHLWQASASEAKVLVAEFADHLALFDVPTGLRLNQQLIDTLARLYPRKPIRQVFVSHHHPAHAGGLKAYTTSPLTIVTTPGNLAFLQQQVQAPHTLGPLNPATQAPHFSAVPIGQATTFADKRNAVQVWELGPGATHHTQEYCVYYFPAQRVLFVGDLVSFKLDGTIAGGERGRALAAFLARQQLPVERIYTAWPVRNQQPFGTLAQLRTWAETQHP